MENYQILLAVIIAVVAVGYFFHKAEQRADDEEGKHPATSSVSADAKSFQANNANNEEVSPKTSKNNQTLIKSILTQLNCQYQDGEDDDFWFTFQGENFNVTYDKESSWIRIVDMQWFDCPLEELEKISYMQKAINLCNSRQCCTACYFVDTDKGTFRVYSKCDILISADFPAPEQYFHTWLMQLFRLKHDIVLQYDKERTKETITNN